MTKMVNDGEKALFVAKMAVNHEKYEIRIIRKIFLNSFFDVVAFFRNAVDNIIR